MGRHRADRPEQVFDQVDAVNAELGDHPAGYPRALKKPAPPVGAGGGVTQPQAGDLADGVGGEQLAGSEHFGKVTVHKANLQIGPRLFGRLDQPPASGAAVGHGFLQQHCLAGAQGAYSQLFVAVVRGGDDDRVDVRAGQGGVDSVACFGHPETFCQRPRLGRRAAGDQLDVGLIDAGQPGSGDTRR